MANEDGIEWNHPWNDPRQAPRNWDRPLEQPNDSVSPSDYADFYTYQDALAAANSFQGGAGRPSGPAPSSGPPRPSTASRSRRAATRAVASMDFSDFVIYMVVAIVAISLVVSGIGWVAQKAYHSVFGYSSPPPAVASAAGSPAATTSTSEQSAASDSTDTESSEQSADPAGVVQQYYDDVNNHDFDAAWALGGSNLSASRDSFAAGYANTARDEVTVDSVMGSKVTVDLLATNVDGSQQQYVGSYQVQGGEIVSGHLRKQ